MGPGDSIRVPVPVGSIVELNTTVARDVTREDVLAAYHAAAEEPLAGILEYSDDPLVSSDITGTKAPGTWRANARKTCANRQVREWRSVIDTDIIGVADTPEKAVTKVRRVTCGV